MEKIRLNELLEKLAIFCDDSRFLKGMSDSSKAIQKDWLFILRTTQHAFDYIKEALDKGGIVLCETGTIPQDRKWQGEKGNKETKIYECDDLEANISQLMDICYGNVCASLCVIGISGTSGKTSVATLIMQLLRLLDYKVMLIGTGFIKYQGKVIATHNTTPGCFQLAQYFYEAKKSGVSHVVMEVSSHAIDQNRIRYLSFDMIAYTNITQDHLDYHLTKTHYRYTKFKLRHYLKPKGVIIYNADFLYMQELIHLAHYNAISFGNEGAHFPITHISCSDHGITFTLQGFYYEAPLLGKMNVYNLVEALVVMRHLKITYEQLQKLTPQLKSIAGRLEVVYHGDFAVWIDYAHTSDALYQLLTFATSIKKGRVITIVGCGGDRDVSKRSVMADIAADNSDIALYTSDNPRGERVCDILQDMMVHPHSNVKIFENRFFAIKHAIKIAQKSDIIIIAGKGNEESLSIRGEEYPFSDRACVNELLKKEEP